MSQEAVAAHAVSKRYGEVVALQALDLTIPEGEVVALLGPNGAGKTTFINIILGLLKPSAGQVLVYGRDPRDAVGRGLVGAMLQETTLPSLVTARELLAHVGRFYAHPLTAEEAIRQAGIADFANRRLEKLSGGQRRRVAFALALVGNPALLFLDEPTEGMDIDARHAFWARLAEWAADRHATVCFSTHDLAEADRYARRIVLLHRGRVVADDTPDHLKRRVGSTRVAFRMEPPKPLDEVAAWLGVPVTPGPSRFHYEAWDSDTDRLLRLITQHPGCSEFRVVSDTLEEVFRALVGTSPDVTSRSAP